MFRKGLLGAGILMMVTVAAAMAQAPASENDDLKMTVETLKQRNRDLERRLTDLEGKVGEGADVQRVRREEINTLINQAMADSKDKFAPGWLDNLKFSGDLRLRYEFRHVSDNTQAGRADDDKYARFRLRFGLTKTWPKEDMEVGFQLATGADTNPTSTNQTFGGTGSSTTSAFMEYEEFGVSRAYAKWTPKAAKGLTVTAGKMANPWETSNIMWDTDVSPEGVWVDYRFPTGGPIEPFVGAGIFQLLTSSSRKNASLDAYAAGIRWAIAKDVKWTSAATFYHFSNLDSAFTAPAAISTSGNTGIAAGQYPIFDFINKVDFVAFGMPCNVFFDWAHNTDNEAPTDRSDALAVGVKVGANKKKGDWSARYVWKKIEQDAVLAYFADSDFGWPNRTARKGHEFGIEYNLTDSCTAGLTLFCDKPLPGASTANSVDALLFQADLVWKF